MDIFLSTIPSTLLQQLLWQLQFACVKRILLQFKYLVLHLNDVLGLVVWVLISVGDFPLQGCNALPHVLSVRVAIDRVDALARQVLHSVSLILSLSCIGLILILRLRVARVLLGDLRW